MSLAIFDLDHTLLDGDTDYLWGDFLCQRGAMERTEFEQRYHHYNSIYESGVDVNPNDYCEAMIGSFDHIPTSQLHELRKEFANDHVPSRISQAAHDLLASHREQDHCLLVITATVEFLADCVISSLDVDHRIAVQLTQQGDRPGKQIVGTSSFAHGKVTRLHQWLKGTDYTLENSWFYSDSINDLPLLEVVDNPVVVNADAALSKIATERNWPSLHVRIKPED